MCVDEISIIRQWFKDYRVWQVRAKRKKPRLHSIRITGLPQAKSVSPDQAIVEYTNATNECKQRLDLLELLKENNDKGELYADIINKRYLKNWTAAKTILYINDNYQLFLSERTFQRYERKALQGALDLL